MRTTPNFWTDPVLTDNCIRPVPVHGKALIFVCSPLADLIGLGRKLPLKATSKTSHIGDAASMTVTY